MEALPIRWLKRNRWKTGIAIAGILLFLILMVWVPVSAAGAYEGGSGLATAGAGTVQATPTEDATVTALNKEKLKGEIAQQQHTENWLWSNGATILSSFFSTLVIVIGALIAFWRWRGDQRTEQEKRAEERFQKAIEGLGDEKDGPKIGAAILLRTFLRPGYEQFYTQTFDLAVAHLRLPRTPKLPEDPDAALPLTTLSQELIIVFKEAFPLARNERNPDLSQFDKRSLDASHIQLDNAYLAHADLSHAWMREASLREAWITAANLCKADLRKANLRKADLTDTCLEDAFCRKACLKGAQLLRARLKGADLSATDLSDANLSDANLSDANLSLCGSKSGKDPKSADLSGAYLIRAVLDGAELEETNLTGVKIEEVKSMNGTKMIGVKGLSKEQLAACKKTVRAKITWERM